MVGMDMQSKDLTPDNTIQWIRSILKEKGISLQEIWDNDSQLGTYAVRLCIEGTKIGTNGKGITKKYALASAYGEFMERYQNGYLSGFSVYRTYGSEGVLYALDEKQITIDELINDDSSFIQFLFYKLSCDNDYIAKKDCLKKVHKHDTLYGHEADSFVSLPFYSFRQKDISYLPVNLYLPIYGSNGMCAGNTREEALVQGFSEIVERYVQKKVLTEKIALPDIPEEVWSRYDNIKKFMGRLSELTNYKFIIKDCSLGGKYPVAALVVIEKNTGKYGIKFGAHPRFEIAIERTFTEASQSGEIYEYSNRSILQFAPDKSIERNIENSFRTGYTNYPIEFFDSESTYAYYEYPDNAELSNKEYLEICFGLFEEEDILIRDVSYSGFFSYHILIPGVSEISELSYERYKGLYLRALLYKYLNSPELITEALCDYLISSLNYFSTVYPDLTMRNHYGTLPDIRFPAEEYAMGWLYLSAMCSYMKGDFLSATRKMNVIHATVQRLDSKESIFYLISSFYLNGRSRGLSHGKTLGILKQFFDDELCIKINFIYKDREKIITKQYPKCDHNKDFEVFKKCTSILYCLQEQSNIDQYTYRKWWN